MRPRDGLDANAVLGSGNYRSSADRLKTDYTCFHRKYKWPLLIGGTFVAWHSDRIAAWLVDGVEWLLDSGFLF